MKHIFFAFLFFSVTLFAEDYPITATTDHNITIDAKDVAVGTSGIVLHKVNGTFEAILAQVEVIKTGANTVLALHTFKSDAQDALPMLTLKPAVGDQVRLGWMYHRAMVIAPNLLTLKTIEKAHSSKLFIHPDLFAAFISDRGHPSPLREDFQDFCKSYDLGLLYFYTSGTVNKVDCHSFKTLKSKSLTLKNRKIQVPMYSRIKEISANWWGAGSDEIKDYDSYYLKLLEGDDE